MNIFTDRLLGDSSYRRGFADGVESTLRAQSRQLSPAAATDIARADSWARRSHLVDRTPPTIESKAGVCRECSAPAELCQTHADECAHCDSGRRPESCESCSSKHKGT